MPEFRPTSERSLRFGFGSKETASSFSSAALLGTGRESGWSRSSRSSGTTWNGNSGSFIGGTENRGGTGTNAFLRLGPSTTCSRRSMLTRPASSGASNSLNIMSLKLMPASSLASACEQKGWDADWWCRVRGVLPFPGGVA